MADAEYAIEIAASMPEGDATTAQLDQMIVGLTGAGKGADFFQVALKKVSESLGAARAASAAANAALADGNKRYAELEKAANMAARAAERASLKGTLDPQMAATAIETNAALENYSRTLRQLEQNAAGAAASEAKLATQFKNLKTLSGHVDRTLAGGAESTEKLRGALSSVPGPAGRMGAALLGPVQGFQKLSAEMGTSRAAMLLVGAATAGLVVGVLALTAALAAGVIALAAYAIGLANSKRDAELATEAFEAMNPSLSGLGGVMRDVTRATGVGTTQLQSLAKQLEAAKVPADDMASALHAAALAEKALGAGGSQEFISKIKEGKQAVGALSNDVRGRLGPVVAKQMRGLTEQSAALSKNFSALFSGLNIEPVLAGFERLAALFDQNTAAGETIKFLFESVFQPLIDQASNAAVVIEAFALGFLIGLTKVYIAVKPAIAAVKEFFGFEDSSLTDTLDLAKMAGELIVPAFLAFAAVLAAVVVAVGAVVAIGAVFAVATYSMIAAVVELGATLMGGLISAFNAVKDYLTGLPATLRQVGVDLMLGLANGITGGVSGVVSAMTGAVGSAIDAARKKLGIASPSKVFAEIGAYTGEGFTMGVESESANAAASMTSLVDPAPAIAKAEQAPASAGAASSSGGKAAIQIENVYFAGAKASKAEVLSLSEMLTRLVEGDVAALGGLEAEPAQ